MANHVAEIESKSHPKGLYLLFFTEMWERFSFYGMRGILILFLTKSMQEGGMGIPKADASSIYGYLQGFMYFTPVIGGILADMYLGQRRAILIGGLLMMSAQFSLASEFGQWSTYLGFVLLIFGNGFFKPNISTMVGSLYKQGDPKRDAGFTIFYMGINLGALLAPLVTGYLAEDLMATKAMIDGKMVVTHYGFRYGFMAAGFGMIFGQIIFNLLAEKLLGDIGKPNKTPKVSNAANQVVANTDMTKEEKDRLVVIFTVCTLVVFFWAGFEMAGGSLSLYTDKYIDRMVGSFLIPTSWFQAVNPLFILLLGPVVNSVFLNMAARNKAWSIPVKMGVGMILLGAGFLLMYGAAIARNNSEDEAIKANLSWLVATYFFHTIGELMLSPIGLSMITRLAPLKVASWMMGIWFFATGCGQMIAGQSEKYIEVLGARDTFLIIASFVIVVGLILIAISRKMVGMMHGRG